MTNFIPCTGCARHVRVGDRVCPFCGADVVVRAPLAPKRRSGRIARAAVMVASTIAPIGCTDLGGGAADAGAADTGFVADDDVRPDSGTDSGPLDTGFVAVDAYGVPPEAGFVAGDAYGVPDAGTPDADDGG